MKRPGDVLRSMPCVYPECDGRVEQTHVGYREFGGQSIELTNWTCTKGGDGHLHFAVSAPERVVEIDYTNHRGERRVRKIIPCPQTLRFEKTSHHPVAQWIFDAWDVERDVERTFALSNLHNWRPVP